MSSGLCKNKKEPDINQNSIFLIRYTERGQVFLFYVDKWDIDSELSKLLTTNGKLRERGAFVAHGESAGRALIDDGFFESIHFDELELVAIKIA